jgi:hypothetical protein
MDRIKSKTVYVGTRVMAADEWLMKRNEQFVGACLLRNLNFVIQFTVNFLL